MDESVKLLAEDVANKINDLIKSSRCNLPSVKPQKIMDKATEEEIIFFYERMCIPCVSNCPNYEPLVLAVCDSCGGEIYAGEHYFEVSLEGYPTFNICEECMDDFGKYAEVSEPKDDY